MPSDEIETGNPGGVGNRPAVPLACISSEDLDYPNLRRSFRLTQSGRNLPAMLSCFGGAFSLLMTAGASVAFGSPFRLALLDPGCAVLMAFGIAVVSFILGAVGFHRAVADKAGRGVWWSFIGIATGVLAIYVAGFALSLAATD